MKQTKEDRRSQAVVQMERELAEALQHFRSAVSAVADRELAKRPARSWSHRALALSGSTPWSLRWTWVPALALLLLSVGLVLLGHESRRGTAPKVIAAATASQTTPAPTVDDAALMTQIDDELSQDAPASMAPLEVTSAQTTHRPSKQSENSNGLEE